MFQIIKNFKSYNSFTFFWLYLPILIFLILLVFKHFYTELFFNFFQGEDGLIENGTFAILFFATLISFSTLNLIKQKIKKKNLFIIYFFFTLGLIYLEVKKLIGDNTGFIGRLIIFLINIMINI
mgnify:CR=1 FL=1